MRKTQAYRELLRAALVIFGLLLAWRFLSGIATAVLVLLMGLLLAVALSGPVEMLHRHKVPRSVGTVLIFVGALAFLGLSGYLFFPELRGQAFQLSFAFPSALYRLGEQLEELARSFGLTVGEFGDLAPSTTISWGRRLLGGALGLFTDAASVLLGLLVIFSVGLYLAARPAPVVDWSVRLFPPTRRPRVRRLLVEIRASLLSWLKGRLVSMAVVGGLSIGALYAIGIPGALFLGLFAGLISFVPYIGPIVSVAPPALLALTGEPIDALWVVLAYLAIQQVETYLVTPLVMQKTASLHPAVAIAAVTLLGAAFGLLGALLSLPAAVVAGVLVRELWFRRLETQEPEAGGGG
jgi:predicted PurR-regulated permease PerM